MRVVRVLCAWLVRDSFVNTRRFVLVGYGVKRAVGVVCVACAYCVQTAYVRVMCVLFSCHVRAMCLPSACDVRAICMLCCMLCACYVHACCVLSEIYVRAVGWVCACSVLGVCVRAFCVLCAWCVRSILLQQTGWLKIPAGVALGQSIWLGRKVFVSVLFFLISRLDCYSIDIWT